MNMASSENMIASTETWAFRPAFDNSWISDAFFSSRDNEMIAKALQQSLSSNDNVSVPEPFKPETPSSQHQTQSVSSSGGGSESETVSKRITTTTTKPAFQNGVGAPPSGKITKRKSRASKRSPTTFINADPENFRQMVQQVTGVRFGSGSNPVLKPEPHRPVNLVNRLQTGCLLPTLDTSAFLLDHHQQQVVGPPGVEFGPPAVVGETGGPWFDFEGFTGFPTLESGI